MNRGESMERQRPLPVGNRGPEGNLDSRFLADSLRPGPGERWAELGTGDGNCAIRAARLTADVRIDALEIQAILQETARQRIAAAGLNDRIRVVPGDVRQPPPEMIAGGYQGVFCNPPFRSPDRGRLPPDESLARCRFELAGGLNDFIACAATLLQERGLFHLVHLPERLADIFQGLIANRLNPCRLIPVHDRLDGPAVRILLVARKGGREALRIEGPLALNRSS